VADDLDGALYKRVVHILLCEGVRTASIHVRSGGLGGLIRGKGPAVGIGVGGLCDRWHALRNTRVIWSGGRTRE
jgi:hypothetical protein